MARALKRQEAEIAQFRMLVTVYAGSRNARFRLEDYLSCLLGGLGADRRHDRLTAYRARKLPWSFTINNQKSIPELS
jgi:hypothetical protein